MPINFGMGRAQRAKREYPCGYANCLEGNIKIGEIHHQYTLISRTVKFSQRFHMWCISDWETERVERWERERPVARKVNGYTRLDNPLDPKLKGLPEEVKRRRTTLLTYLNHRDINSLVKAYNEHKTERVYTVMQHMTQRMAELELIDQEYNIKSPWWILHLSDFDILKELIMKYDSSWWNENVTRLFFHLDRIDRSGVISVMLREGGEYHPPYWGSE